MPGTWPSCRTATMLAPMSRTPTLTHISCRKFLISDATAVYTLMRDLEENP